MAALTKGRTTPQRVGDVRSGPAAANAVFHQGGIVMRDASGNLVQGQTATGLTGVGMGVAPVDNTGGIAGAVTLEYTPGRFRFENSAGGDLIAADDIGGIAYVVDDQTVALTNGSNARSPAGTIEDVDAQGVWIIFDEALTRAATA
ncbi:MAG: hypothetical protein AAFO86_06645 [Pseudomonadota bacterium]